MDVTSHHHVNWSALRADFVRVANRDRWGLALMMIGWIHLAFSVVYQAFYVPGPSRAPLFLALWVSEVTAVAVMMRRVAGRGWYHATPLAGVVVRVWATFLILSMSVATLNGLTGWALDWFKAVWCTLASFGFATMAWLLSLWFLVPAFQMYFTGLLIASHPGLSYLIHGISWWAALQGIGWLLVRRRARRMVATARPAEGTIDIASPLSPIGTGEELLR